MDSTIENMLLTRKSTDKMIGKDEIVKANDILSKYKAGKKNLENRVIEDEYWWKLRHWEVFRKKGDNKDIHPEPSSAWLFNAIMNKHADAMDNIPEPVVLPRERSDEASAKELSSVLPVVMEYNGYEDTYSLNWLEKLKHGTGITGVFWNPTKENGIGDIEIRGIDLLNIFWEPGITDIQESRNLFIAKLVDTDILDEQYSEFSGSFNGGVIDISQYVYDDTVDTTGKSVVIDWYYKVATPDGRKILQYVKYCGENVLFSSEDYVDGNGDMPYRNRGYYDHGLYPVVFDCLFPEKGTPVGFGYVAICKSPQLYIDKLSANILQSSMMGTKKRFFVSSSTSINKDELLDWNEPVVHVEGGIDDTRIREFTVRPLDSIYFNVMQEKINEMKETAANRDVNSGGTGGGVSAAAAIAALQEAGNKLSRDMISASYRSYANVCRLCIELMRQFYDERRSFRITGEDGLGYQFIEMSNAGMTDQLISQDGENPMYRHPVFDLKVKAQKKNPFSRMEQNELMKELYRLGFFNPQNAQQSLGAIDMMTFEGSDKVREFIQNGATLENVAKSLAEENALLRQIVESVKADKAGANATAPHADPKGDPGEPGIHDAVKPAPKSSGISGTVGEVMQSRQPMTDYGAKLAERSIPSVE